MKAVVSVVLVCSLSGCKPKPSEAGLGSAEPAAIAAPRIPGSVLHPIHPPGDNAFESAAREASPERATPATTDSAPPHTPADEPEPSRTNRAQRGAAEHETDQAASASSPAASAAPGVAERASSVPPRRGAAASGPSYETWLETTGGYTLGAPSSVALVLHAKAPYKCNVQYPYKLVLDPPPDGMTYATGTVRGMHVDGKTATMTVPFTATSAGTRTIGGTLSFSTCTTERCLVDKAHVNVAVNVR